MILGVSFGIHRLHVGTEHSQRDIGADDKKMWLTCTSRTKSATSYDKTFTVNENTIFAFN